MKINEEIKTEFRNYIGKRGYTVAVYPVKYNDIGVSAMILGHDVKLKHFTTIRKEGENTIVRLSVKDFSNETITSGLFKY